MPDLHIQDISIMRKDAPLFAPLSVRIAAGSVCALMGASGIGKSSIIAYIAGLLPQGLIGTGSVFLHERDITNAATEQRQIGLLFQDDLLFPHLSVAENLGFAIAKKIGKMQRQHMISAALSDCGLMGYGDADPSELSGGQRARVAMQRVLLSQPKCLLLDEPFGKLDQALRGQFRDYVFAHVQKHQLPCLMVSHDLADTEHSTVQQVIEVS